MNTGNDMYFLTKEELKCTEKQDAEAFDNICNQFKERNKCM